jgi:carbonic anhydrase/acetyltransferase-like protein (isoleucine patch superfamily)
VVSVSSGAVVPKDCTLEGNIHIGEGTVLHPRCKIIAEKGSITIGKYNIIEEHSTIVNSHGTPRFNHCFLTTKVHLAKMASWLCRGRDADRQLQPHRSRRS